MNKLSVIRGTYEDYIKWNGEQYLNSPFALNIKNGDTHYYYIMNCDEYFSDYCVFVNEDNLVNLNIVGRFMDIYKVMLDSLKENYDYINFESDEDLYDNFKYLDGLINVIDNHVTHYNVSDRILSISKIKCTIK